MDSTTTSIYKPLIHEHPLVPTSKFVLARCPGCNVNENIYGGYYCNKYGCGFWFHKECVEAPLEINHHPSHPQHPLFLTSNSGSDGPCDLCGQKLLPPRYSCSFCDFNLGLTCGMKPSPIAIEHPLCHDHPLTFLKTPDDENPPCEVCKESINGPSYSCTLECNNVYFHVGCVKFSKEVNHPCHSNHPLKFTAINTLGYDAEKTCLFCEGKPQSVLYHCSICNFSTCLVCTRNPPPLVIDHIKTHKHPLTLFIKSISFTCDACGLQGNVKSYICFQCGFIIHGQCIDLPHVININRHDHRISFTELLGPGYSKCGVCRQSLSQYHGAYTCSFCTNYAVHSRCAVKPGVWDYVELEGITDVTEDIAPFKVVGDDLISHFSHDKHPLKLYKNYKLPSEWIQCEACSHPFGFDSIYACEECSFFLHEKCANLPKKKRLIYDIAPYTLVAKTGCVQCTLCRTLNDGFKYISPDNKLSHDVHCGSLYEPFLHEGHLHPLYFYRSKSHRCDGCRDTIDGFVLRCDACDFDLCLYCACLPKKILHRNDDHPLTLYCGEKVSDKNWCDICERELSPCKWFYTCHDCGINIHARCVLGDFSRLKLRWFIGYREKWFQVVINNHNTRPLCRQCHSRCKVSIILKDPDDDNGYICSLSCFFS